MRSLIGFMEAWTAVGEPTPRARISQARVFVDLCMLDRAWIRLKEITESDPYNLDALKLTAKMFIRRGWPNRARKVLEQTLAIAPDDPALQQLWDDAAEAPREPDPSLEEAESIEILLPLAESYLATGAMLKGRALLERLKRDFPSKQRVDDLLWVLAGDFSLGDRSLADLADTFGPDLSLLADLAEDAEHTESVTKEEILGALGEPRDAASFPSLFRKSERTQDTVTTTADEVTRTTSLADLEELRQSVAAARKAAGIVSGEEDTQIRRIIRRDNAIDVTDAGEEVHLAQTVPDDVDFDLERYRRDMGMREEHPAPALPASDLDDAPEEEDDDLIILTKREREDESVQTLEPDPTSEEHPDAARFLAEAERYKQMEEERRRPSTPADDVPTQPLRGRRRRRIQVSSTPVWLLILAVLLGIAAFFLSVLVVIQFLT
ncbi:MAG: hypothetical protein JRI25_01985 [Deltaproteobacteria bacterium]|nr:hypothetical protein [Deltaproteobacteria bacterium]